VENRHQDTLRRIAQADAIWADAGHEPVSFHLLALGGMQTALDHPGWDESWAVPSKHTIDDLGELGYLRVEPIDQARNNLRTFALTMAGRAAAAAFDVPTVTGGTVQGPNGVGSNETGVGPDPRHPTAFVIWAHGDRTWEQTVYDFTVGLRGCGIDADVDLFHQHDPGVDFTTLGPRAINSSDFVLIAVSAAYRERWEGTNDPTAGAGAVREANVLKSLFNENQDVFRHKVKVVVLPGATDVDIPGEIKASVVHFAISAFDADGLEPLLRTITRQPAHAKPILGALPRLPPRGASDARVAPTHAELRTAAILTRENLDMLRRRIARGVARGRYWHDRHASDVWDKYGQTLMVRFEVYELVAASYLWFHELNQDVPFDSVIPIEEIQGLKDGIGQVEAAMSALRALIVEIGE
jgi:hypothetical protein